MLNDMEKLLKCIHSKRFKDIECWLTFIAIIIENKKGIKMTVLAIIPTKSFDKLLPNTPDIINPVKGNNNMSSNNILRLFAIFTISIC